MSNLRKKDAAALLPVLRAFLEGNLQRRSSGEWTDVTDSLDTDCVLKYPDRYRTGACNDMNRKEERT